jgi:hypothetical protein
MWFGELIEKLKSKRKFKIKPTDFVLVRNDVSVRWELSIYSHRIVGYRHPFQTLDGRWEFIAPYKGNETKQNTTEKIDKSWGVEDFETWDKSYMIGGKLCYLLKPLTEEEGDFIARLNNNPQLCYSEGSSELMESISKKQQSINVSDFPTVI